MEIAFCLTIKMTIDVQLVQSSKKKHRKDRKGSDDQTRGGPSVTEREEKRKKRKERKKERVGASDGALSFSFVFAREADSGTVICAYSCGGGK